MRRPTLRRAVTRLAALVREERAVAAIEFGIIAPIIIVLLLGTATYFSIGREDYRSKRATYTAADIVSRQTSVSNAFLANVKAMAEHIATGDARTVGLRVTSAQKVGLVFVVNWSYATTPFTKLTGLDGLTLKTPDIASGESVIIVELSTPYKPLFGLFGSTTMRHENASYARPRTVSTIPKTD